MTQLLAQIVRAYDYNCDERDGEVKDAMSRGDKENYFGEKWQIP